MDLSSPISSVIPSAHGAVLAVLARTTEPLSGRRVAALTDGKVGQWRANEVLGALADAGIVLREHHPPAKLYRLNRDHVAAAGIIALTGQWETLLQRIRDELAVWSAAPVTACLFGSAARGEAGAGSDIDILLVRSDDISASEEAERAWQEQVDRLTEHVRTWSGNACEILELTAAELAVAVARDDRVVRDLLRDAIALAGQDVRSVLRRQVAR
ncbi:MAG: nucleotidyltransferase domain-containing protein [Actinomycetes bacterium]